MGNEYVDDNLSFKPTDFRKKLTIMEYEYLNKNNPIKIE